MLPISSSSSITLQFRIYFLVLEAKFQSSLNEAFCLMKFLAITCTGCGVLSNIHKNLCCEFLHLCLFLRPSSKVRTPFTRFGLGFSTKQTGNFVGTLVERTFCSWIYCGLFLLSFGIPPLFWKDMCSKQSLCKVFQRLNYSCDLLWM